MHPPFQPPGYKMHRPTPPPGCKAAHPAGSPLRIHRIESPRGRDGGRLYLASCILYLGESVGGSSIDLSLKIPTEY
jgi:hypothetical protein